MEYKTYLTAEALMHKIDSIEKAIEYMETVLCSTECHDAVVDMLKYDKDKILDEFRQLGDEPCKPQAHNFVWGRDASTHAPEGIRPVTRDDLEFSC